MVPEYFKIPWCGGGRHGPHAAPGVPHPPLSLVGRQHLSADLTTSQRKCCCIFSASTEAPKVWLPLEATKLTLLALKQKTGITTEAFCFTESLIRIYEPSTFSSSSHDHKPRVQAEECVCACVCVCEYVCVYTYICMWCVYKQESNFEINLLEIKIMSRMFSYNNKRHDLCFWQLVLQKFL